MNDIIEALREYERERQAAVDAAFNAGVEHGKKQALAAVHALMAPQSEVAATEPFQPAVA